MNNHYVKERIITEGVKGYNYCKKKKNKHYYHSKKKCTMA
jgi:hypothetical protein